MSPAMSEACRLRGHHGRKGECVLDSSGSCKSHAPACPPRFITHTSAHAALLLLGVRREPLLFAPVEQRVEIEGEKDDKSDEKNQKEEHASLPPSHTFRRTLEARRRPLLAPLRRLAIPRLQSVERGAHVLKRRVQLGEHALRRFVHRTRLRKRTPRGLDAAQKRRDLPLALDRRF